jgi:hypothetical protein
MSQDFNSSKIVIAVLEMCAAIKGILLLQSSAMLGYRQ